MSEGDTLIFRGTGELKWAPECYKFDEDNRLIIDSPCSDRNMSYSDIFIREGITSIGEDALEWLHAFKAEENVDYHGLRIKVWENTLSIVRDGGYTLPNGRSLLLESDSQLADNSVFYREEFHPTVSPADCETEITVTQEQ